MTTNGRNLNEQGFFSPNRLSFYFKKLVNEAVSDTEIPQGLSIKLADPDLIEGPWGAVYSNVLGDSSNEDSSSDVLYSETHGPATTLKIKWNGGESYKDLEVSVDLTLILDLPHIKAPYAATKTSAVSTGLPPKKRVSRSSLWI